VSGRATQVFTPVEMYANQSVKKEKTNVKHVLITFVQNVNKGTSLMRTVNASGKTNPSEHVECLFTENRAIVAGMSNCGAGHVQWWSKSLSDLFGCVFNVFVRV